MTDDQAIAIMVSIFRNAERISCAAAPRPLDKVIADARNILARVRATNPEYDHTQTPTF